MFDLMRRSGIVLRTAGWRVLAKALSSPTTVVDRFVQWNEAEVLCGGGRLWNRSFA